MQTLKLLLDGIAILLILSSLSHAYKTYRYNRALRLPENILRDAQSRLRGGRGFEDKGYALAVSIALSGVMWLLYRYAP